MTFDWGSLAKFPLSENSDKIRLTELAKNQTFPLFMTFLRLMVGSLSKQATQPTHSLYF